MVVSAILLTALAPITGALFGASYGTAIRIGYEIIFPALFGDMINEQKNKKVTNSNEEGAKRTIKALHTMFTATGGASAMEFGIEQGIEMAKKKTESPDVQHMIDLNLGLTEGQVQKRGKAAQFQDPVQEARETKEDIKTRVKKFKKGGDFIGMSQEDILDFFSRFTLRTEFDIAFKLLVKHFNNNKNHITVQRVLKLRPAKGKTSEQAIEDIPKIDPILKQIALLYARMKFHIDTAKRSSPEFKRANLKKFLTAAKIYNRFVTINRRPNLQVDTAKSMQQLKIIPKK